MGDDDQRLGAVEGVDGGHHPLLGFAVEGAGRLVEHEHLGVVVERSGDADPLALATRQSDAPLTHEGVGTGRQAGDKRVELGRLQGPLDRSIIDILFGYAKCDIPANRVVAEIDRLRDVADRVLPATEVVVDVVAIDRHASTRRRQQPKNDIDECAFPGTAAPHEADRRAVRDADADRIEDVLSAGRIAKADVLQGDRIAERHRRRGLARRGRVREIQLFQEAAQHGLRGAQPVDRARHVIDRGEHAERHRRKQSQHRKQPLGGGALPHHDRREEQERRDGEEFEPEPWHLVDQRLQRRHPGLSIGVVPELV